MKEIETLKEALRASLIALDALERAISHKAPAAWEADAAMIVQACASAWEIVPEILYSRGRGVPMVHCRQTAMAMLHEYTGMSPREIAAHFRADMSHSTVNHAITAIAAAVETDPRFKARVEKARALFRAARLARKEAGK